MTSEPNEKKPTNADETIPSMPRPAGLNAKADEETPSQEEKKEKPAETAAIQPLVSAHVVEKNDTAAAAAVGMPPWTLQQFFNGEIDLDVELSKRFPQMPMLSTIHFRNLGTQSGRGVASLTSADGGASVVFDADPHSRIVNVSFTFGSMITLRFHLDDITDTDRNRWLELMRREQGGLAFLWGPSRWEKDYVICISRRYFTNFYAFSPRNFEASIRMTPEVTQKLIDWLETFWKSDKKDDPPPPLLTW